MALKQEMSQRVASGLLGAYSSDLRCQQARFLQMRGGTQAPQSGRRVGKRPGNPADMFERRVEAIKEASRKYNNLVQNWRDETEDVIF